MSTLAPVPRSDRGPNARKPITVLFSDEERQEVEAALERENKALALLEPVKLATKLRHLALLWARAQKAPRKKR
jgi:hypothetical protein